MSDTHNDSQDSKNYFIASGDHSHNDTSDNHHSDSFSSEKLSKSLHDLDTTVTELFKSYSEAKHTTSISRHSCSSVNCNVRDDLLKILKMIRALNKITCNLKVEQNKQAKQIKELTKRVDQLECQEKNYAKLEQSVSNLYEVVFGRC